jgi:VanZ family protein
MKERKDISIAVIALVAISALIGIFSAAAQLFENGRKNNEQY